VVLLLFDSEDFDTSLFEIAAMKLNLGESIFDETMGLLNFQRRNTFQWTLIFRYITIRITFLLNPVVDTVFAEETLT
jgi:hypothetical protein